MKPRLLRSFTTPATIFVALAFAVGLARADAPRFNGNALPLPPQQNAPWTPPATQLSPNFLSAAQALFSLGLADPRGGEYREITVVVGSVWGESGPVQTHGWVLPGESAQRFAVCWNGLVYPLVNVGAPADLAADIQNIRLHSGAVPEAAALSQSPSLALGACLLLRLGNAAGAEKVWAATKLEAGADPFVTLASNWAWALFDRSVCAHMRGDDRLALLGARQLSVLRPKLESLAEERGGRRDFVAFLAPLPRLLADQERRAASPNAALLSPKASNSARIAALIRRLEEVRARQWGQPGGVSLNDDPIVQELVAQGEIAVGPLLQTLETDTRLTRSVAFRRDFFMHRHVIEVPEAAYAAVTAILRNYSFGSASDLIAGPQKKAALIARLRDYWATYKKVKPEVRWFATLANDKAAAAQWLQAAQNIAQRKDVERRGNWLMVPARTGVKTGLRGEELRARKKPSVSELMAKRVEEISLRAEKAEKSGVSDDFALDPANEIAECLAAWDLKAALPVLRRQFARGAKFTAARKIDGGNWGEFAGFLSRATVLRAKGGDGSALADYAAWIASVTPAATFANTTVFEPLWLYPRDEKLANVAESLFNGPKSPWNPLVSRAGPTLSQKIDLISSPLLAVPAFRRQIARLLDDATPFGSATVNAEGLLSAVVPGQQFGGSMAKSDALALAKGRKMAFRVCDMVAWKLSGVAGAPRCELYWPPTARDKGVKSAAQFLRVYGVRLQPPDAQDFDPDGGKARLVFPHLNRIASADDVQRGAAIFTLTEPGQKRITALKLPLRARRKAGKARGWIWQAEELLQKGVWRRFYGFVGPHEIVKIPVEEIELGMKDEG